MLARVRIVALSSALLSAGCTPARHPGPGPIRSSEIASALTRTREHRDAPLGVHDAAGHPYALSQDEPVYGPTPPDGADRASTVRVLAKGCEDPYRAAPANGPCWFARTFTVEPGTGPAPRSDDASSDSNVLGTVVGGVIVAGLIGGAVYCNLRCPEPWDTAVPVGGLTLVVAALVVGAYALASSIYVR